MPNTGKQFVSNNQVRISNISVVRIKKAGQRFELLCDANNLLSWRKNNDKINVSDILKTDTLFSDASKGRIPKKEDIFRAFGTENLNNIHKEILSKGTLQIPKEERQHQNDELCKEIAQRIADTCYSPKSNKCYHVDVISEAMKDLNLFLNMKKPIGKHIEEVRQMLIDKKGMDISSLKLKVRLKLHNKDLQYFQEEILTRYNVEVDTKIKENNESIYCLLISQEDFEKIQGILETKSSNFNMEVLTNPLKEPKIIVKKETPKVTKNNMSEILKKYRLLVLFCYEENSDGLSKLSYFEEAAEIFNSEYCDTNLIFFGRVDHYKSDLKICQRYNIWTFPRILCLKDGDVVLNCDDITRENFMHFVKGQIRTINHD